MIREFADSDLPRVVELLKANHLEPECMPDLLIKNSEGQDQSNPLFVVKKVFEKDGKVAQMCFLKVRSELYFFIDHEIGTPEERWAMLREFKEDIAREAWTRGFDQMTAFVSPEIEKSFQKRLEDMGFIRSQWIPYSLNIT